MHDSRSHKTENNPPSGIFLNLTLAFGVALMNVIVPMILEGVFGLADGGGTFKWLLSAAQGEAEL